MVSAFRRAAASVEMSPVNFLLRIASLRFPAAKPRAHYYEPDGMD